MKLNFDDNVTVSLEGVLSEKDCCLLFLDTLSCSKVIKRSEGVKIKRKHAKQSGKNQSKWIKFVMFYCLYFFSTNKQYVKIKLMENEANLWSIFFLVKTKYW